MTGVAAKTTAMFNNGVTSVEVVDSDNDDNVAVGRSGIKKYWVPSVNKLRQLFTSSSDKTSSNDKRHWCRHQNKQDTENEQYFDQDDDQDDYSDKQELHQLTDFGRSNKDLNLDDDEDDDEDDDDEEEEVKPAKKAAAPKRKKADSSDESAGSDDVSSY